MPRTLRRLSASVAALALALGGVGLTATTAQAATHTLPIAPTTQWGDTAQFTYAELAALFPGGTIMGLQQVRWLRASDGSLLGNPFYSPTVSHLGSTFYGEILVNVSGPGYGTETVITTHSEVVERTFSVAALSVAGSGAAGSTLSVTSADGYLPDASYSWEWRRVSDDALLGSGSDLTLSPYTVTAADAAAGSPIYAKITAVRYGYTTATWTTSPSPAPHLSAFANVTAVPLVSGTGRLGTSFTASYDVAGVTPAPTSVTLRWYTSDGTIVGLGASFTPTNALLGESLYVTAVLSHADHVDHITAGSVSTAPVALAEQSPGAAPVITGRNALGGLLTASVDPSGWSPVPDSFDYQWYLEDGTAIPDADEATLAMTAGLVGEIVYVVATAHAADHLDVAIPSALSGRIVQPTLGASASKVTAGGAVTVNASGLLSGESYTIELHSTPVVLGTVTADAAGTVSGTFTIPASTLGGPHTLVLLRGGVQVAAFPITVTAASGLAATGADAAALPLGAALLALGALALGLARRRAVQPAYRIGM